MGRIVQQSLTIALGEAINVAMFRLTPAINKLDIIGRVDQTNTQTQAGQNAQNLQSVGSQAQQTAGNFQAGSSVNLSTDNTSNALNQGISAPSLTVGVAGVSTKTSTEPSAPVEAAMGISGAFVFVPLLLLFVLALALAYRRIRKFDERALKTSPEEVVLLEEIKQIKNKKKKKKPKKPHHH